MSENDHWLLTKDQQNIATDMLRELDRAQREFDAQAVEEVAEVLTLASNHAGPDAFRKLRTHARRLRDVAARLRHER